MLGGFDRKVTVLSQLGNSKYNLGENFKFSRYLDSNEKTNVSTNRGVVTSLLKGIEKK